MGILKDRIIERLRLFQTIYGNIDCEEIILIIEEEFFKFDLEQEEE